MKIFENIKRVALVALISVASLPDGSRDVKIDIILAFFAVVTVAAVVSIFNRLNHRTLKEEDVEWVVNDLSELGVRVKGKCYFLYKGRSLTYDNLSKRMVRGVYKREFGECCHPNQKVSLSDSDQWEPIND